MPLLTLSHTPKWDSISRPLSELNWRYVSVQAGLGKNVQVGQEAGKSVQACIASNENPLKNHITRLREQETGGGAVKEANVLPMAVSPRVPAPQVGGLTESRLMGKGAKRSINKVPSPDEDKENIVGNTGSLKRKGTVGLKKSATRATAQQAFVDIPEEVADVKDEPVKRRLAPPLRKPSGEMAPAQSTTSVVSSTKSASIVSHATLSQRVAALRAEVKADADADAASGPKRVLRGSKDMEDPVRPPTQAELNVPSRVPARVQAQRATLKRTKTEDNLKHVLLNLSKLIQFLGCGSTSIG
jgi:hypothetical protein